jgi:hypothetical protein
MRAVIQDVYGPAEVLELRDVDRPVPGQDEVLIRVRAAGVDQGVWHLMAGLPYLTRAVGFGLRKPKHPLPPAAVTSSAVSSRISGRASISYARPSLEFRRSVSSEHRRTGGTRGGRPCAPRPGVMSGISDSVVACGLCRHTEGAHA